MKKQLVVTLLKYGLGIGLLVWVVWRYWEPTANGPGLRDAFQKVLDGDGSVNFTAFLVAVACYFTGILLTFYRWYVLVRAQDLPFTFADSVRLGLIGFYLSTFLPGSIGGDIVKAAFVAREQSRRTVAVATVLVDRFIGLCGLFWLVALIGGVAWLGGFMHQVSPDAKAIAYLETIVLIALGATAASFAVWFVAGFVSDEHSERFANGLVRVFKIGTSLAKLWRALNEWFARGLGRIPMIGVAVAKIWRTLSEWFARGLEKIPKIGVAMAELWRALHMYRQRGGSVVISLLLSMVGHIGFVLTFYFAALTLTPADAIPTMACHFLIIPVGMMFEASVPLPGGVGGGEIGFGFLYEMVGYLNAAGVLGSLVRRVITWTLGLIGYLVYLRMKPALQPARKEMAVAGEVAD